MLGRSLHDLRASRSGVAAAEMVLMTPLLLVLMMGAFEVGNYFYSEHVVATAVRDGARYASRLPFTYYPCGGAINPTSAESNIKNITMNGAISGGNQRLANWNNVNSVTVTFACVASGFTYVDNGIFRGLSGGVRFVTVTAVVPYKSLFARFGITNAHTLNGINLVAQSQAAVVGI